MKLIVVDQQRVALCEPVGGCLDLWHVTYLDGKEEEDEIIPMGSDRMEDDDHVTHIDRYKIPRVARVTQVSKEMLEVKYDYGERETVKVVLPTTTIRYCKKDIRRREENGDNSWIPIVLTSVACAVVAPMIVGVAGGSSLMGAAKITHGLSKLGGGMNMGIRVVTGVATGVGALAATLWSKRKRED